MIREISKEEVVEHFFELLGELECGRHIDCKNPRHAAWLEKLISQRIAIGVRFLGYFVEDDTPAGLIAIKFDEGPDGLARGWGKCEILDLGFHPEHRGKGYGTKLMSHVEGLARDVGVRSLYVSTYARERQAITFYGKCGLVPVATLPDVHGPDGEGMVYMRKVLR
jgi:GNAT superfamily N-acetyltransferase